jgi:CHAT domain-containing protein
LINLAALPTGRINYLLEAGPLLHYLSAERDLVRFQGDDALGKGILALGAPAFDEVKLFAALRPATEGTPKSEAVQVAALQTFRGNRSGCKGFQSLQFEGLPASGRETKAITDLWQTRQAKQLRGAASVAERSVFHLRGSAASEGAFKQHASGRQVLHLATHGFFLGGDCPSALDVQAHGVTRGENPLLHSGLVMAGANHRMTAAPTEEDGILTAEEIAALDLRGVEWAVLSGCDTGVGEVKTSEGVLGLRRAFQVAGARTLIMSLWPVEDEAAQEWMLQLYRARLRKSQTTMEAMHNASLWILSSRRAKVQSTHPFYWASFVAAGDWR